VLLAVAGVVLVTTPATGAPPKPVVVDDFGLWTLHRLGYPDEVRHGTRSDLARPVIHFGLPRGAAQGPQNWYLVRLNLRLTLAPDSEPGVVYVTATTDSATCGLVELKVSGKPGAHRIAWTSVGIVDGVRQGTVAGDVVSLHYANYLQRSGVQPGSNDLDFQLAQREGVRVAELRIYAGSSGIEYTPLGPANVRLTAGVPRTRYRVGQRFDVAFALRNVGERTAKRVSVHAQFPTSRLRLVASTGTRVASLTDQRVAHGHLTFIARSAGVASILLTANTSSNHPGDGVTVHVLARH
jgi:hypothetical protein